MSFNFWQKWLVGLGIYLVILGLIMAFFGKSHFMDWLINQHFDPIFWPDNEISHGAVHFKNWIYSVLGAVLAGWGIVLSFLAYYPFKLQEKWAWSAIAIAVTLWFVVDTSYSLYYGVTINAILNAVLFGLFAVPLFFTRKHFFDYGDK